MNLELSLDLFCKGTAVTLLKMALSPSASNRGAGYFRRTRTFGLKLSDGVVRFFSDCST